MVKCSHIIDKVISGVLNDFNQSSSVQHQYKKLFENFIKNSYENSDITRLIESIDVGDD